MWESKIQHPTQYLWHDVCEESDHNRVVAAVASHSGNREGFGIEFDLRADSAIDVNLQINKVFSLSPSNVRCESFSGNNSEIVSKEREEIKRGRGLTRCSPCFGWFDCEQTEWRDITITGWL
jgi:hypothetical protein